MASIEVQNLSLRFPVYGADHRSLKKHFARLAVGGQVGTTGRGPPVVTALNGVSLSVAKGDRLGLIGPNGSGKTTLLRVLAGAYAPDEGLVEVRGRVASLLDLGLGIDPSATGYENIRLRGLVAGLSGREIERRMDEIADFTGLGAFLSLPLKTYSAGMMARLAFAVSTSVDADVLLMDEWITVGDADFRDSAKARLESLVERSSVMVLATHEHELLRRLCNKFVYMQGGHARDVLPIEDLDGFLSEIGHS